MLGDARRRHDEPDRQVVEYLQARHGDLWYEQLAEAMTRRLDLAALKAAATTAPRHAELAFYTVTLGLDPAIHDRAAELKLLQETVDAQLLIDDEQRPRTASTVWRRDRSTGASGFGPNQLRTWASAGSILELRRGFDRPWARLVTNSAAAVLSCSPRAATSRARSRRRSAS